MSAGKIVMLAKTPSTTPFAITSPISTPKVKVMKHNAINPATVVSELPEITDAVVCIACDIARCLSPG